MSTPTIQHYINGQISEGRSGQTQDVFNPATGKVSGQTALANRGDVDHDGLFHDTGNLSQQ